MNKKRFYIISSTLLLIGLFAGVVQYIGVIDTIYAAINNPGHSWSQMECNSMLCIDEANNQVIIENLKIKGKLYDESGLSVSDTANLRFTSDGIIWDTPLTWTGSVHGTIDCNNIGGIVVDGGSGTICKINSSTVPTGWTQAAHWQRYSLATWGGDSCGEYMSTAPTEFNNQVAICISPGVEINPGPTGCIENVWDDGTSRGHPRYIASYVYDCATYRTEIGVF